MIIYKTINTINGKIYIGKACGRRVINGYLGSGLELTPDIIKYGVEKFRRITIDFPENRQDQNRKEIFWIAFYRKMLGRGSLYNISNGGGPGRHFTSKETREKISNKLSGRIFTKEWRDKLSVSSKHRFKNKENHPWYRRKHSKETLEKMRDVQLGKYCSEETKNKMSISHKGKIPWNKGKRLEFAKREFEK